MTTTAQPVPAEFATAPTPKEIDALVRDYAEAQAAVQAAARVMKTASVAQDQIKARLTLLVESFGLRHTEKSKRLTGLHNFATTTTGTRVSIDQTAVTSFKTYLDSSQRPELVDRFFSAHTSYSLVEGPADVLRTLDLGKRATTRIASLVGLCFKILTNAPSLKIDLVVPDKGTKTPQV
jgi:hypothetical protein